MMRRSYQFLKEYLQNISFPLLLFFILVLNVKMLIKIPALIIFLIFYRRLFKEKAVYKQRYTWFYWLMIAIATLNLLIGLGSVTLNYLVAFAVGITFWMMCIAAAYLNYWFIQNNDLLKLHNTITLFFVLNILFTIGQLIAIIVDAGALNPYLYQGMYQKYFINTGDRMSGISLDVSTTNAILNAFAVFYFLYRNKLLLAILAMITLLLTTSNFTNVLMVLIFVVLYVLHSSKAQKSVIVFCAMLLIMFMVKVSPQNNNYLVDAWKTISGTKKQGVKVIKDERPLTQKPDSILSQNDRLKKQAVLYLDSLAAVAMKKDTVLKTEPVANDKPSIPVDNIHTPPFQRRRDTTELQRQLLDFATTAIPEFDTSFAKAKHSQLPGKLMALKQTYSYLKVHPLKAVAGIGIGKFASKLAFRASGLHIAGGYPQRFAYTNEDFRNNHLNLYLNYFSKDMELHSLIHTPNSVYDQMVAEYGIIGLAGFFILYLAFFVKEWRRMSFGIPLFLLLLFTFGIEYWFEQLSIVIVFEFLMLLETKQIRLKNE